MIQNKYNFPVEYIHFLLKHTQMLPGLYLTRKMTTKILINLLSFLILILKRDKDFFFLNVHITKMNQISFILILKKYILRKQQS